MKFNNKLSGVSNRSNLLEISRKHLVSKTKVLSPDRYNKRLSYGALLSEIANPEEFIQTDNIVIDTLVGDYVCTIQYSNVIKQLIKIVKQQPQHNVTLQSVIRAVTKAIDYSDVYVDCTCGDFIYRFSYYATKFKYKYGKPETRPPKIRNPHDNIGAVCKHLTSILYDKKWLASIASDVNKLIKDNIDTIRKEYNVSEDEFYIRNSKRGKNTEVVKDIDTEEGDKDGD